MYCIQIGQAGLGFSLSQRRYQNYFFFFLNIKTPVAQWTPYFLLIELTWKMYRAREEKIR